MKVRTVHAVVFALAVSSMLAVSSAYAAKVTKLPDDAFAPLRGSLVTKKIRIDRLPVNDNAKAVIDLEEFQVWAPGAKVVIHGDNGKVLEKLDPPAKRFFRGLVNGDPESFAYFSMDRNGRGVEGLVVTRDKKFAVRSVRRARGGAHGHGESDAGDDTFLTEYETLDMLPDSGQGWQCELDKISMRAPNGRIHATGAAGLPVIAEGISGTQTYAISVEIETDNELYVLAGSNSTTLLNYITNLTGAVSTIYNRDLKTNVTQRNVHIYTTASDPWSAVTAPAGLAELGTYYHNTYGGPLGSGVMMLSGKNTNSGIAWEGIVCGGESACGPTAANCGGDPTYDNSYAGPYAWSGSIITAGTIPDPDSTQNGVLYGMPNTSQYWPLLEYAHEFGHVMGGHHTHCVTLTLAEQTATGRGFVDLCYGTDPFPGCYAGATSVPLEKGTIMSYCHLSQVSGFPQSRYTFGQAIEVSHHELDDYMLNAGGPLQPFGGNVNIVTQTAGFTMSAINAPSTVPPNSTGNVASITANPSSGATYAWTILNGTITSDPTLNSITFTAGSAGTLTLRATAYAANGCGITDTKLVTVAGSPPSPPTNVTATATTSTNVHVTWTAGAGSTSYHVYRTSDNSHYTLVGSPTASPFDDTTVAANTAYLYDVKGFNGVESTDSNLDLATTVIFSNSTLTPNSSTIQAADLNELRTAIDAVRVLAGLGPGAYNDPTLNSTIPVKVLHITDRRANLDEARQHLSLTAINYTDNVITAGSSPVNAVDVLDLRSGVQ